MTRALRGGAAVVAAIVAIAAIAVAWFYDAAYHDRSLPTAATHVVVQRGSSFAEITVLLASKGVIGNAAAFRVLAKLGSRDTDVHAGEYLFPAHQTESEILRQLQTGGAQVARWVTIPEGFTAKQIAQRFDEDGVVTASALQHVFDTRTLMLGGVRTKNLEGYLFPSTYLIPSGASPARIAAILTGQFMKELPAGWEARAKSMHMTVPQIVTVASLVVREAKVDEDRALIASVIYNRLKLNMPLQVDATIEYALPEHKTELSFADLAIDSPYNSYKHTGLPPTPIASPGLASLQAAFYPAKTEYLYYVYKGNGRHAFAKTLAEHNANVAKYLK